MKPKRKPIERIILVIFVIVLSVVMTDYDKKTALFIAVPFFVWAIFTDMRDRHERDAGPKSKRLIIGRDILAFCAMGLLIVYILLDKVWIYVVSIVLLALGVLLELLARKKE